MHLIYVNPSYSSDDHREILIELRQNQIIPSEEHDQSTIIPEDELKLDMIGVQHVFEIEGSAPSSTPRQTFVRRTLR